MFDYVSKYPFSVIPLEGKRPLIPWKEFQKRRATLGELLSWFGQLGPATGVGVVCGEVSNLTVIDFDEMDPARAFFRKHADVLRCIVQTRRGVHFYFQGAYPTGKFLYGDIKGEGSYVVAPPSVVDGHEYTFVEGFDHFDDLCCGLPMEFDSPTCQTTRQVRDALSYIMHVESVQGQNGSAGLIRALSILRDESYSEAESLLHIMQWNKENPNVNPEWSDEELVRATTNVYRRVK